MENIDLGTLPAKRVLTLEVARALAERALEIAKRKEIQHMVISVVDDGGHLIVLLRPHTAEPAAVDIRIVDVAFGETLPFAMKLLKQHGVIATYASDAQPEPTIPFWPLIFLSATIRFVDVYGMSQQAHESAIELTTRGLQEGWLKTTIASRFPLEQIVEAHEATESGKMLGNVVVLLS